jgi:hypothetical protein
LGFWCGGRRGFNGSSDFLFFLLSLRLGNNDVIGDRSLDTELLGWIRFVRKHNLYLNTHNSLLEENVSNCNIDVIILGLTSADHVSLLEFHGLGSLLLEFTRDDNFATLGTILNNWFNDVVGSKSEWHILEQFVVHSFNLSRSAETLVLNGIGENLDLVVSNLESLLDELSEFLVFLAFNTNNLFGLSGLDSNFSLNLGSSDFNTSVTSILKGFGEETVQFCVEDTVCDELLLLVDLLILGVHDDLFFFTWIKLFLIFLFQSDSPF